MLSTFPSLSCPKKRPSFSARSMYGRMSRYSSSEREGTLTAFWMTPRLRYSFTCSAICTPTSSCASFVDPAMCGVAITFGAASSAFSFGGSWVKTSRAAPAIWPELSACNRAASSISSPRAQFTRRTPFFIFAIDAALIMPAVCGVKPT